MKIKPCKKCGSTEIELWDCGYSSFNPGGGKCKCGYNVSDYIWQVSTEALTQIWNDGQKPNDEDKLKIERRKTQKLRKQLRALGETPIT